LPPPTGTALPLQCPKILQVGGPIAAFVAGGAFGTALDQHLGISDIAGNTGKNVRDAAYPDGVPTWTAEVFGLGTTASIAGGGPFGIILYEIFGDD
jgi:hypothetical protein